MTKAPHAGKIYIAGHRGLVGSSIYRALLSRGVAESQLITRTHAQLDLTDQKAVRDFFEIERPQQVYLAAAKVGGIVANASAQVGFLYENTLIEMNVIRAAADFGVDRLLFLGSSCIYPRDAAMPLLENALLTGSLEKTNEAYSIAKIVGLKLCEYYAREQSRRFISAMPCNLYGPGDNFHPTESHVIPGMMRRFHEAKIHGAKSVVVWGSGKPIREFLFVEDFSEALLTLMESYQDPGTINVGSGVECTIADLAKSIQAVVGFTGSLEFDHSKPDGTPRKILDITRIQKMGWKHRTSLQAGLETTYAWALKNQIFDSV